MTGAPRHLAESALFFLFLVAPHFARSQDSALPIPVKVVVVTMFERGEDTGDAPGEFQLWVEREHLDRIVDLPAGYHHLRMNNDGVLGMVAGAAKPCSLQCAERFQTAQQLDHAIIFFGVRNCVNV